MSTRIIDSNVHLRNEQDLLRMIAESTVTSFKLEGISIPLETALKFAKEAADKFRTEK